VGLDGSSFGKHAKFDEVSREILRFLNRAVLDVRWTPEGTVTLIFDEGGIVQIYDDSAEYESYTIKSPSGLVGCLAIRVYPRSSAAKSLTES
jgi:hypothetical protein